jgi:hypothetical protein
VIRQLVRFLHERLESVAALPELRDLAPIDDLDPEALLYGLP